MWEPIGVVFAVSLVWMLIRMIFCGEWRNAVRWCYLLGGLGAWLWRLKLHIQSPRYHNVFLFVALFCILDLFESFPLPKVWKRLLFFAGIACCFGHAVIVYEQDRQVCQLYETIRKDAAHYHRTLALSYDTNTGRHRYYTQLALYAPDRQQPLAELARGLKENLRVYDGDYDAVYLFAGVKKSELALLPQLATLMPEMEQVGMVWMNRYHKKALVVYRYLPKAEKPEIPVGALISNGDFSQSALPARRQQFLTQFGKNMPRVNDEAFDPPANWNFYQSLAGRTNSFFTIRRDPAGTALHLEADGYLAAISPAIELLTEKKLSFSVKAESESLLQISRGVREGGLFPIVLFPLKAGEEKRYEITLPVYPGKPQSEIWFWLDHGAIDLKDVRIR